jgi:hypothetical protein
MAEFPKLRAHFMVILQSKQFNHLSRSYFLNDQTIQIISAYLQSIHDDWGTFSADMQYLITDGLWLTDQTIDVLLDKFERMSFLSSEFKIINCMTAHITRYGRQTYNQKNQLHSRHPSSSSLDHADYLQRTTVQV